MPEFRYARGRVIETLAFITKEMNEFDSDYISKTWQDYAADTKLQKLIDRTIGNILTAIIEVSGVVLTENNVAAESYPEAMRKIGSFFGLDEADSEALAKAAIQRNRLAHRYLNFRWQVVNFYIEYREVLKKLVNAVYEYEKAKKEDAES